MRIIVSVKNFYPPIGGAEKSIELLIKKLAEKHTVAVICSGSENKDVMWSGFPVHIRKVRKVPQPTSIPRVEWLNLFYETDQWRKIFELELKKSKPELVITQLEFAPPTAELSIEEGIPVIVFVRSYEHFCPIGFLDKDPFTCNQFCWQCIGPVSKAQYIFIKKLLNRHKKILKYGDLVLANSEYIKKVTERFYGRKANVMYPFIDLAAYRAKKHESKYLLFVGKDEHKGLSILLKIAEQMADKNFMILGKLNSATLDKIKIQTNVQNISAVNNMQEIYSQTALLLMPRLWPEPFGRIVIEAGINGIPTVASNVGGLSEAVSDGGVVIDNYKNIEVWTGTIRKILDNDRYYSLLATNAKRHAERFDFKFIYNNFKTIVEDELDIKV